MLGAFLKGLDGERIPPDGSGARIRELEADMRLADRDGAKLRRMLAQVRSRARVENSPPVIGRAA